MDVAVTAWQKDPSRGESVAFAIDLGSIADGRANIERIVVSDEDMNRAQFAVDRTAAVEALASRAVAVAVKALQERREKIRGRAARRREERELHKALA